MRILSKLISLFLVLFFSAFHNVKAEEVISWESCIREAEKNHPDLISAQENVLQFKAAKKITASSLFPQVTGDLNASTARTLGAVSNSFDYGVSGTQLLFDGLKTIDNVKSASQDIAASQYNYKFTSSEVRLRLRTAFINLLTAQELLNITQEIYNIRRGNLELITLRYQSGLEHRGALLNAEANLLDAQFDISQANRDLEVAQRQLVKEMGWTKFAALRVEGEFEAKEKALEKPDFEFIANTNPSLGKLIAQKNSALYDIDAAKAGFLPELNFQTGIGKTGNRWPAQDNQWNAGLALSFPIFEGGLKFAEVAQAKSIFNQAKENERSTKDSIILSLQQTWAALQDALEFVSVQKKFLEAAQERSNIAEAQYSLGLIQFDNWTIIEDDLVSAKKALLNAQANVLIAEANWIQAKGETLEYAQK